MSFNLRFNKRSFPYLSLLCIFLCGAVVAQEKSASKPNIVWLVSEDNSTHYLKLYNEGGAETPAIAKLASEGLIFQNAYSNAPVCSAARTTLATAIYGPEIGASSHRAFKEVTLPKDVKLFHEYLKEDGYYVTNQVKTDYNVDVDVKKSWSDSSKKASWKNRDNNQPFFHMQTIYTSHESALKFKEKQLTKSKPRLDLSKAKLPKYYPDTEIFRYTTMYYNYLIQRVDSSVAKMVQELEKEGVLEDTFIFYFSDHGGVLPRSKGYIYDQGLHVPLVVRVPKNFQHLVKGYEKSVDGSVEFVDFGPTALNLAGVDVPKHMKGKPFLGANVNFKELQSRTDSFGYADRMGAKYDLVRSIKRGKFQYIRAYQPNLPDAMHNGYRYKTILAYRHWRDLYRNGELSGYPLQFFQPKTPELLFDTEADPDQVVNLAADPKYQQTLSALRAELTKRVKVLPDLGILPESYLAQQDTKDPLAFGESIQSKIAEYVDTANLQLEDYKKATPKISKALDSKDPITVMWALGATLGFDKLDKKLTAEILAMPIENKPTYVIARYAEVLGKFAVKDPQPLLAKIINKTEDPIAAVELFNSVVYLNDFTEYKVDVKALKPLAQKSYSVKERMNYLAGKIP